MRQKACIFARKLQTMSAACSASGTVDPAGSAIYTRGEHQTLYAALARLPRRRANASIASSPSTDGTAVIDLAHEDGVGVGDEDAAPCEVIDIDGCDSQEVELDSFVMADFRQNAVASASEETQAAVTATVNRRLPPFALGSSFETWEDAQAALRAL